jgi:Protein of unknown function (DUF2891)
MKKYLLILLALAMVACKKSPQINLLKKVGQQDFSLSINQANRLAMLPVKCIDNEYPNKLGQTLGSADDIKEPKTLHPAFYGCFDWHSAVHGHWSLVKLLKEFPDLKNAQAIKDKLKSNLSKDNILAEVAYFNGKHNSTYERTYGWAWLLKLAEELHTWDTPLARELESNLQPLTDVIAGKFITFLPKLNYPIRVGEHPNTAFGLSFAYDYSLAVNDTVLKKMIEKSARNFYLKDIDGPLRWEPNGFDFLSPCLEEVDLMRKVLPASEFKPWLKGFLPQIVKPDFNMEVGRVSDRTDGKLVHLDGLNFSRAWCLYGLAKQYPEYAYLSDLAAKHLAYSLPSVVGDHYEGGHWLGSFAIYALNEASQ